VLDVSARAHPRWAALALGAASHRGGYGLLTDPAGYQRGGEGKVVSATSRFCRRGIRGCYVRARDRERGRARKTQLELGRSPAPAAASWNVGLLNFWLVHALRQMGRRRRFLSDRLSRTSSSSSGMTLCMRQPRVSGCVTQWRPRRHVRRGSEAGLTVAGRGPRQPAASPARRLFARAPRIRWCWAALGFYLTAERQRNCGGSFPRLR